MESNVIASGKIIIENRIFNLRGMQVMIDRDLAELYGVETKVLNQAVKRNIERFPPQFRLQLTDNDLSELVTICDQFVPFLFCHGKAEITGKTLFITLYCLFQGFGLYSVKFCQMEIKHDPATSDLKNFVLDDL